jgi:hypothetical protein
MELILACLVKNYPLILWKLKICENSPVNYFTFMGPCLSKWVHRRILFRVTRIQYVAVLFVKSAERIFMVSLCSEGIRMVDACIHTKPELMSWHCQRVIILSHWNTWGVGGWDERVRALSTSGAFTKHQNKEMLVTMVRHRSICKIGNHKFMINFGKQDNQSWLSVLFNDAVSC